MAMNVSARRVPKRHKSFSSADQVKAIHMVKVAGKRPDPLKQIALIREGYGARVVDQVAESIGIPRKKLVESLRLSDRTIRFRSKKNQRLSPEESQKIHRVEEVFALATEVLESKEKARQWLTTPAYGLGNVRPLDFLDTDLGLREVNNLLSAIEWGNYY
jgi:putative toxin-antitoxin system antitoxin component (TIGR02293 family)